MGLKKTADRLIIALNMSGHSVRMEQKTFFSRKYERMMTKYIVSHQQDSGKWERVLETYKLSEVVKLLAGMYTGEG